MTDLTEQVRTLLAPRYQVERQIGRGSNALVYRGNDTQSGRVVAIKVLLPDLASTVSAERFLLEIRFARELDHPGILSIYDSGAAAGQLYYVMPFIEGETLRARMHQAGQLSLEETVRVARDVAGALGYAHGRGIVHRDIKPENLLLCDGRTMVADFGIARAMNAATQGKLTRTGMTVGTPAYMSPEQTRGNRKLDGRSDLYSLSCVVYEMLAGHPPFVGSTPQEVMLRHLHDPVPRLVAARRDVPEAAEWAILRAMAKKPGDRFSSVTDFVAVLSGEAPPKAPARISLTGLVSGVRNAVERVTRRGH